ncbi:MAG: hypothetical protein JWP81_1627 [Ferruginibacter sp.]|nr:hypothetical protein [Ferruginibacter sp.]
MKRHNYCRVKFALQNSCCAITSRACISQVASDRNEWLTENATV